MTTYDIPSLERAIDNVENNDAEAHKLYNNLGLAYAATRKFRLSLKAHREEKRACKRLASDDPSNPTRLLDLAIAYRRCGDVMLKVDRLIDVDGRVIDLRRDVIAAAREQHLKGLEWAKKVASEHGSIEVQAASAAVAQSSLALALDTKQNEHFVEAARCCYEAGRLADQLADGHGVTAKMKDSMLLGASLNMAIALSGLSEKEKAKKLLQAVAIRAKKVGDDGSFIRAMSNLAEEAGEDEDWDLCEAYVREWIRLAQTAGDEADESDALRKLAVVLRERRDLLGAKHALKRSLLISTTRDAKKEARRFLEVIEQEMDELERYEVELQDLEEKAKEFENTGDFVEEARARLEAGNCAFALKQLEDVARLLGRYFALVDDYGCNTAVTGVEEPTHNSAVANLAEVMWKMGRLEEAVKWASRELTCFDDDVAGQAQAWCNLGVYLDDFGKKERAIEALKKSIELAEQSGEDDILKRARNNLQVVQHGEETISDMKDDTMTDVEVISSGKGNDAEIQDKISNDADSFVGEADIIGNIPNDAVLADQQFQGSIHNASRGERSVVVISSQAEAKARDRQTESRYSHDVSMRTIRPDPACNSQRSRTRDALSAIIDNQSRSRRSQGNTGESSSGGFKKIFDLVSEYKSICNSRKPSVPTRPALLASLRALSSALLAREACETQRLALERLDVSSLFLNDNDVSILLETLSCVGGEQQVQLDLSLNPLISPNAYDSFARIRPSARIHLDCIKWLDLSCAGLTGKSFLLLSDCFREQGSFAHVVHLNVSKNALGRQCELTAQASALLLKRTTRLEVLDLSLNLLTRTFMKDLLWNIEKLSGNVTYGGTVSAIQFLDLHLNNRRYPSALLQDCGPNEAINNFSKLFKLLPSLASVDVRACGACFITRRALHDVSEIEGSHRRVITLSANVREHDTAS